MTLPCFARDVVVDNARLETLRIGAGKHGLPTIVLLHEGLGSVALWKDFPIQLAERTGLDVLAYSRRGYGKSDPYPGKRPVGYLHHEAEVVLPALLDAMGVARPILFGHSDGASIALIHAGRYPEQPLAVIVEAPHVFVEDLTITGIFNAKIAYQSTDLQKKLGRYHRSPDDVFWGWNDVWLAPRFRDWNIEDYLPAIRCPVLLIQGENDEYGTSAQLDAIAGRVPDSETFFLPDCGHSPHREMAGLVLDRTGRFIAAKLRGGLA